MAREKNTRKLNFKPVVKSFIPEDENFSGISTLLHEEIEAIHLMDVLGMYQEDAAKSMEISRPTFTRILKSARQKVATALVCGYKLKIEDEKDDLVIALCANDLESIKSISPIEKYILFYRLKENKIECFKQIENPVYKNESKPAIILPKLFIEEKVNIFVSSKVGEGLKNSLLSKGIKPVIKIEVNPYLDFFEL